jgi:capsular polysaccharide export protein
VGGFFARVADALHSAGAAAVHKINFNGGDWWFFRKNAVNYRGSLQEWPAFLTRYLERHEIDVVVLFGDCRPIHRVAVREAARQELPCWVFEEGYIRPNYVTFERHGVNGYSELPTDTAFYADLPSSMSAPPSAGQPGWRWPTTPRARSPSPGSGTRCTTARSACSRGWYGVAATPAS